MSSNMLEYLATLGIGLAAEDDPIYNYGHLIISGPNVRAGTGLSPEGWERKQQLNTQVATPNRTMPGSGFASLAGPDEHLGRLKSDASQSHGQD